MIRNTFLGAYLAVQWLRLSASTAGSMGLIPGRGTKISHAMRSVAKKERNTSLREDQQGSCGFKIHQLEVVFEIKEVDSHPKRVQGKHGDVGDTL